jgi:hypothetical protein
MVASDHVSVFVKPHLMIKQHKQQCQTRVSSPAPLVQLRTRHRGVCSHNDLSEIIAEWLRHVQCWQVIIGPRNATANTAVPQHSVQCFFNQRKSKHHNAQTVPHCWAELQHTGVQLLPYGSLELRGLRHKPDNNPSHRNSQSS